MTFKDTWKEVPKPLRIMIYTVLGIIAAVGFGLLFGWVVVWLWNWLMPMIFGLPTITFWQGVGIFILAKILFGGIGSHGDDHTSKSSGKKRKCIGSDWKAEVKEEWRKERQNWRHYDEWWESEGREAFEQYADQADAEPEPKPEEPKEDE